MPDSDWSETDGEIEAAEAIVIGSGFGGAVAACRLAQAGFNVLVLERGRRYEPGDFPALPVESAEVPNGSQLLPELRRWTWQSDQGLWDILDLEEIIAVQAAGYGGGSLLYANVHLRPPSSVFDARWPREYRDGKNLEPFFDLVAYMLDAAPIDAHPQLGGRLIKSDQLRQAANLLGRGNAFFSPPLTINRSPKIGPGGRRQNACIGCGKCCSGCPEGAKNTLDYNYLAIAEEHGARVRTQCEVVDIVQANPYWKVKCVDHLHATQRVFAARYVFLCAGSVHSTRLMARAKFRDPDRVKERVGVGYFPGGDALGMVYETEQLQYPSLGPTITTTTVHWESFERGSFMMIQDGGYAEELERLTGILRATSWLDRNRLARKDDQFPERTSPSQGDFLTEPLPSALRPGTPALSIDALMPSPLDAVLAAVASGAGNDVIPPRLRQKWPFFLDDVTNALLLPEVVDRTIDGALRARLRRFALTRCFREEGWFLRLVRRFVRWLIRRALASDVEFARFAMRALLGAAGLPRAEVAKRLLGYDSSNARKRTMLLAMGRDAAQGVLRYDESGGRLVADLDLYKLGAGYTREEQLMTDLARTLGGELRTNPAWNFLGKPITVHNQGGCPMSDRPEHGVAEPNGQVHGVPGLYVLDGSVLCTSVGVNPSPAIAAIAERNVLRFIERNKPLDPAADFWKKYESLRREAQKWRRNADARGWNLSPPEEPGIPFRSDPLGLCLRETMHGYCSGTNERPSHDHDYQRFETLGRPQNFIHLKLLLSVDDLATFFEDPKHKLSICGQIQAQLPGEPEPYEGPVAGHLQLLVRRRKQYGIRTGEQSRRAAQQRLAPHYGLSVDASGDLDRKAGAARERLMRYRMRLVEKPGWFLSGYKRMRNDPGLDAWRDTTHLFIALIGPSPDPRKGLGYRGAGVIHADLTGFLFEQLATIEITGTDDPARIVWATASFASFFFGSLQRIYLPQLGSALNTLFRPRHPTTRRWPVPPGG